MHLAPKHVLVLNREMFAVYRGISELSSVYKDLLVMLAGSIILVP